MLTKKMHDSLGKHVVTVEQLKKEKTGYTDQFQLDFLEIMKVFIQEEENKEKGVSQYVPPSKPKEKVLSAAQQVRNRMNEFSKKIAIYGQADKLDFARPERNKKDELDVGLQGKTKVSDVGKVVAYKQQKLGVQTRKLRDFIKKVDGDRKLLKRDELRKSREKESEEIKEACEAIKLKYFSNAMQPHEPNLEFEIMMNLSSDRNSIAARSIRGSQSSHSARKRPSMLGMGEHRLASALRQEGKVAVSRDERVKFIDEQSLTSRRSGTSANMDSARLMHQFNQIDIEEQVLDDLQML